VEHFSQGPGCRGGQREICFETGKTKVKREKGNMGAILIQRKNTIILFDIILLAALQFFQSVVLKVQIIPGLYFHQNLQNHHNHP